ncbi:MAG: Wzz/FepE/Etk N-terminal domain-containing protein, partial [Prolixibacteraceae bacterium]|nr:Wzz/FepE/Etk N-terminal domain-containing protein [Prolixibacteraceae bacterium]
MMALSDNNHIPKNLNNPQEEDTIDLKKIVVRFLRNWYWFLIAVIISLGLAFLYNIYMTPVYQIYSTLLVEEGNANSPLGVKGGNDPGTLFQGLGIMSSMRNINNQMEVLHSTPVIAKTLDELNFEVSYYEFGPLSAKEIYDKAPFSVIWDENHPQIIEADFYVELLPTGKIIIELQHTGEVKVYSYKEEKVIKTLPELAFTKEIEPGTRLVSDEFSFSIVFNNHFDPDGSNNFKFRFNSKNSLIKKYRSSLQVDLSNKETSILDITLHEPDVHKGIVFLNKL